MKYILLLISIFILTNCNGQSDARRTKWKTQIQRCLDSNGDPIENCIALSDENGEYHQILIDDLNFMLQSINESSVDSIYTFNDTLYIVYFDAPTLKYKAGGLNGLFSASNQSKVMGVSNAKYASGGLTFETSGGLGKIGFNTIFNSPLVPTGSSTQGYALYGLPSTGNRCQLATSANSQVWSTGSVGTAWTLIDQTHSTTQIVKVNPVGAGTTPASAPYINIQGDGDLDMSAYRQGTRTPVNNWLNVTHTGTNGQLEIASKQAVIDTVKAHIVADNSVSILKRKKINLTYLDFDTAYTSRTIPIFTLPANSVVHSVVIHTSTIFDPNTPITLGIGKTGDSIYFNGEFFDVHVIQPESFFPYDAIIADFDNPVIMTATLTSCCEQNLSDLTQGIATVWIYYSTLD